MHSSVSALIGRNADYLVHATSVHLRHASHPRGQHAEAIQVLGAVMRHGDEGVCPMMKDCVNELLVSLDTRQLAPPLVWAGLQMLAESCECWVSKREVGEEPKVTGVGPSVEEEEAKDEPREKEVGIQAIADFFLQYHQNKDKDMEREESVGGVEEEEEAAGEDSYSQERPLPAVEQVCVELMRRCGHHMSHDNPHVRLVVLGTLQSCLKSLRHEEVSN